MSMYVGWEQGAFAFKPNQMDLPKEKTVKAEEIKEPLKSELLALIKERKLDKAVTLYEKEYGKQETSTAYKAMLKLAEQDKGEQAAQ